MRVPLFVQVLPVYLLIASFFVLPMWQRHEAVAEALQAGQAAQNDLAIKKAIADTKIAGAPTRIVLPSLGIDLTVVQGAYNFNSNVWSVTNLTANYAQNTAEPNNKSGKTLIYGHWTSKVFGPTKNLKPGDLAYVYTTGNHVLAYRFSYKSYIKPTDTAVLDSFKGKPGLVLMTCDGTWAQERRLMYFDLKAAK